MGHNPRGFWYQIYALHLCQGQVLADLVAKFVEMPSKDELEKRNMDEK